MITHYVACINYLHIFKRHVIIIILLKHSNLKKKKVTNQINKKKFE